jgi:hypothetical protein
MAGRRTLMRIGAYKAYLSGATTFNCLSKTNINIDAYLNAGMKANAKANLANLEKQIQQQKEKKANTPPGDAEPKFIPLKDTNYNPDNDPCFIIANGESRRGFNLNQLKHKGYIIGMNVLPVVEDFWPDALVSVDISTVKWICERNVPDKVEMWSYPRGGIKDQRVHRLPKDWGWSSGPTAVRLALEHKHFKKFYIFGMDFFGLSKTGDIAEKSGTQINNMYKGTPRYRSANSSRTYFGNWLNQMTQNVQQHPKVNFYHVIRNGQTSPGRLLEKKNWIDITYSQFEEHLSKMPKKEP